MVIKHSAHWRYIAAAAMFVRPGYLNAATSDAAFFPGISTVVEAECYTAVVPLTFGQYNGLLREATGIVLLKCTDTTPYSVGLDGGTGIGSTGTDRTMTGAKGKLFYSLFMDAAYTMAWGQTGGEDTFYGTGNGAPQPLTIYGRIPGGQFVTPGQYDDTIAVSITY